MKKGFVYVWKNLTNNKKYIGYHVGHLGDGYVSSSHSELFWNDFNNPEMKWIREIVFTGDSKSCLIKEQELLKKINLSSEEYYNNARGAQIIFTDEVRKKIGKKTKERLANLTEAEKKGKPRSEETKYKLRCFYDNDNYIGIIPKNKYSEIAKKIIEKNTGKKRTKKFKKEQSERFSGEKNPMFGKQHSHEFKEMRRELFLKNNPGKNKSELTKKRISDSKMGVPSQFKGIPRNKIKCPYCDKIGGIGVMNRWHFENCKNKK